MLICWYSLTSLKQEGNTYAYYEGWVLYRVDNIRLIGFVMSDWWKTDLVDRKDTGSSPVTNIYLFASEVLWWHG